MYVLPLVTQSHQTAETSLALIDSITTENYVNRNSKRKAIKLMKLQWSANIESQLIQSDNVPLLSVT